MVVGFGGILGWDLHSTSTKDGPLAAAGREGGQVFTCRLCQGSDQLGGAMDPVACGYRTTGDVEGDDEAANGEG
jgi:hypothetical protein